MAPRALEILLLPAAGEGVGGGHVMRDLALAAALGARGADCRFLVPEAGAALIRRFGDGSVTVHVSEADPRSADFAALAASLRPDAMVLDSYVVDAGEDRHIRAAARRLAAIDDLARPQLADLLVDPGHGRTPADYAGRVPSGCRLLLGPAYALVRPQIAALALEPPRQAAETVAQVFVSFGLSDVEGIAARAVRVLRPLAPHARFDVALAADAVSRPTLQAMAATDARLRVHPDARDIGALMRGADVAVGAGGSSTWERFALGLPTLAVVVADNQRQVIRALAHDGRLLAVDLDEPAFETRLAEAFAALAPVEVRARLAAAGRALCDGQGAARVAEAILALVSS